jgi:general secretion pathway protein D
MHIHLSNHRGLGSRGAGDALAPPLVRRLELKRTFTALVAASALTALFQTPGYGENKKPLADPFAQAAAAAGQAQGANPFRPKSAAGEAAPLGAQPAVVQAVATTPVGGADQPLRRAQSDRALLEARRALSVGDVARAQLFLGQAEALGVKYDGPGDAPLRVAESIHECQQLNALRKAEGGGNAWRQAYSRYLVTQADALVGWGELDAGARAANEAAQLNPQFAGVGPTPQSVLDRIRKRRAELAGQGAPAAGKPLTLAEAKQRTAELLMKSRAALQSGNLAQAEALSAQATALGVPEAQFAPQEDRPSRLASDLQRARGETESIELAEAPMPITSTPEEGNFADAAAQSQEQAGASLRLSQLPTDSASQTLPGSEPPLPLPMAGETIVPAGEAFGLMEDGEKALKSGNREEALKLFRAAYGKREELDLVSQQRLQGHLQMLSGPSPSGEVKANQQHEGEQLLEAASGDRAVLARQMSADIGKKQSEAAKLRAQDPNKSLAVLRDARHAVETSQLDENLKNQLMRRLDLSMSDTEKYIKEHKAELDLDAANQAVLDDLDRERQVKVEVSERIATMVDQFNKLIDEKRFSEAEVVANRLYEMAPDELVAQQINKQAKMIRREQFSREINELSEKGVAENLLDVRRMAAEGLDGANKDIAYGDTWDRLKNRKAASELNNSRNLKEMEIEQKLRTPVLPRYDETPLTKVVEGLSQLAGVNIHLDPRGMEQEGVPSDAKITLNLPQEISLKSALTLILEPLHLTYTIQDEVLKITSEQIRDGELKIKTYPVGDLVVPIPNFVPNNNIGLQGLINDAYASMGGAGVGSSGPLAVVAGTKPGEVAGPLGKGALAQQFGTGNPSIGGGASAPMGGGPGGLGGAANADFDSLIDLIVSTVDHDSWMENGTGEGEIQPFPTNLSLVVSQTQRVHEQIADLLEQLRRLQDLQVTIEVRFIRLTDSFFERIGVDFDFNIEDRTGPLPGEPPLYQINADGSTTTLPFEPNRNSLTVGVAGPALSESNNPNYRVDLDLPFRQGGFELATPQFGAFNANSVGSFGFAILSDIEAWFVIQAGQGDQRANVLQAPKVTLFNGQQALVVDAAFRPFVISVIPVVGEFAAAQQPVIVVLSEGTMMSVQAVVSDDRRYVRMTLVPFFSHIGEVRQFTFEGSESTSSSSASTDDDDGKDESSDESETTTRSGTTVQLPTFEVISVSTTVSVPDGGTVLLGGIKRLREGRNEFGVPLLSKIAYIDRLFRNVGIGRDTESLMMMVTPHIIIQEEKEEELGISTE